MYISEQGRQQVELPQLSMVEEEEATESSEYGRYFLFSYISSYGRRSPSIIKIQLRLDYVMS